MSAASVTASTSFARSIATDIARRSESRQWVTLAEASRIINRHVNAVKSIALAGGIKTQVIPGARIRYSRADAERLAAS